MSFLTLQRSLSTNKKEGSRGGREEDVKMLWNGFGGWEKEKKKKKRELFVAAYLTGYEATQWLWHLAK